MHSSAAPRTGLHASHDFYRAGRPRHDARAQAAQVAAAKAAGGRGGGEPKEATLGALLSGSMAVAAADISPANAIGRPPAVAAQDHCGSLGVLQLGNEHCRDAVEAGAPLCLHRRQRGAGVKALCRRRAGRGVAGRQQAGGPEGPLPARAAPPTAAALTQAPAFNNTPFHPLHLRGTRPQLHAPWRPGIP